MNKQCDYCIQRKWCTKIEKEDWSCTDYEENEKLFDDKEIIESDIEEMEQLKAQN